MDSPTCIFYRSSACFFLNVKKIQIETKNEIKIQINTSNGFQYFKHFPRFLRKLIKKYFLFTKNKIQILKESRKRFKMSDFKNLYKNVNQLKEQQSRRRENLLTEQRNKREEKFSFQRDLEEILAAKDDSWKSRPRTNYMFKDKLMLSEWMMELPEDIDDFLLIACPKGKRCTLATDNKRNKSAILYYKNGERLMNISCNVPASSIFDCIYSEVNHTIFILDVLTYAGRDLSDCDTSFRFFWLKSKFIEDNLKITGMQSSLKLNLLTNIPHTDNHEVSICFQTPPLFLDGAELDGFLFYHKDASYTSGETPLVLWLFPFMVPELFNGAKVSEFSEDRPENYTNYLDYIEEFNEKLKKKRNRGKGRRSEEAMEQEAIGEVKEQVDEDENFDEMQAMIDLEMTGNDV